MGADSMAWQICDSRSVSKRVLLPDEARVRRDGTIIVTAKAAADAGLAGRAVLMVNPSSGSIGLRPLMPDENLVGVAIRQVKSTPKAPPSTDLEVSCRLAFKTANWPLGKTCKVQGLRKCYVRAASADGPAMLIVKIEDKRGGDDE